VPQPILSTFFVKGQGFGTSGTLPTEFSLSHNFPNPFNPTTEIEFALPKLAHVRLEIYNIMGQKIVTLIDTQLDAGYHSIMWNAGNAATGLYFYRLQADEFVDTKKMLLMK
jgi:hypothetical protein